MHDCIFSLFLCNWLVNIFSLDIIKFRQNTFPTYPIWHCCRMLLMFAVITDTAGKTFGELFDKADHYSDHSPDSDPSQTNYFCHKNTFQCISPLKGPNILEKNTTPEIEDKTSLKTDMLDVHSSVFRCTLCVHLCPG